jgi:hypothetical protein
LPDTAGKPTPGRTRQLIELTVLWSFAVAQPVLDVMGRSAEFFVLRGSRPLEIVLFAVIFTTTPPLVLWLLEIGAGLVHASARRWIHFAFVAALAGATVVTIVKAITDTVPGFVVLALAASGGYGLARALQRVDVVRSLVAYLTPAPIIFVGLFLLGSEITPLVRPDSTSTHQIVGESTPVIILFLDELPVMSLLDENGEIPASVYPNFARLAAMSTFYRNTTAVSGFTQHAVPSMLSGYSVDGHLAPVAADHPDNLFTLLGATRDVHAFETVTAMCPSSVCQGSPSAASGGVGALLQAGADVARAVLAPSAEHQDVTRSVYERTLADVSGPDGAEASAAARASAFTKNQPARFAEFLDLLPSAGDRSLLYLHILLPHAPWRYLPNGQTYVDRQFTVDGRGFEVGWPRQLGLQRHLVQLAYTDRLLGLLLDELDKDQLLERSIVLVSPDHGEGFVEGESPRDPERDNVPQLAWVPMFLKTPGQTAGRTTDAPASTLDILPTIADLLHVDIPWQTEGRSLAGGDSPNDRIRTFYGDTNVEIQTNTFFERVSHGLLHGFVRPDLGTRGLFAVGPYGELFGRSQESTKLPRGGGASVDDLGTIVSADGSNDVVPALVTGRLAIEESERPMWVAVVVNGQIAGLSPVFTDGTEPSQFAALIDPSCLGRGSNEVAVLGLSGPADHPRVSTYDIG